MVRVGLLYHVVRPWLEPSLGRPRQEASGSRLLGIEA